MKKNIAIILLGCAFITVKAQNLETKIPKNSDVVISGNAEKLFELISETEFDRSILGEKMLKELNRRRNENNRISSVREMGYDIRSNAHYFLKKTDSITYHGFLVKLNDRKKVESLFSKREQKRIEQEKGYNYILERKELFIWNDHYFLFLNGDASYKYFREHEERFNKLKEKEESTYKSKRRLVKSWIKGYAFGVLNNRKANSIAVSKAYQKSKNKEALVSVWIPNYDKLMQDILKDAYRGILPELKMSDSQQNMFGVEQVAANLFFEKDGARAVLDVFVSPDFKKPFSKVYNKKMNSHIVNGFNHDKVLAFWSMSLSTEEALKQYPQTMKMMYGNMLPQFKDEIGVAVDFLSILLDEKAIGELLTGDMFFAINDFSEKEVTYTSYEYDEDFNRIEVEKTRNEMVPDAVLMVGSKEEVLLEKLLNIGIKYKVISPENNLYRFNLKDRGIPFDLYAVVKNDVFFIATSKANAVNFAAGRKAGNTKKYRNLINKNSTVVYTDFDALFNKALKEMMGSRELRKLEVVHKNLKDAHLKMSKMRGNKISTELRLNTKGQEENALKLLFRIINESIAK